jgi:trigger factor
VAVTKKITPGEHSSVTLTLTVDKAQVTAGYNNLVNGYTKTVQIRGFRKGKAPREVLERKFGDALKEEALLNIVDEALQEVFAQEDFPDDSKPLPYSSPQIDGELPKLSLDSGLVLSFKYDVFPRVEVPAWDGIAIQVPVVKVETEDVNRELEAIRERNALVLDREEGAAAEKGNVVTIDYLELDETGAPVPASEREDYVFTLGSGMVLYKIDDDLLGMKAGDTKDIGKTFPADYEDPVLAGQTKRLRVTLKALKRKDLPALDDDFAQDVNEKFKTLKDLKADIKDRLQKNLDNRLREIKVSLFLEKLLEKASIDLPESMLRIELESRWRNMARQFNTSPEGLEKLFSSSGRKVEDIFEEWKPSAEKALDSRLLVEAMIKDLKIEAGDEELEGEFARMAENMDAPVEEIKKYYEQENMKGYLREDLRERKLFDEIFAKITIKNGEKQKYIDLLANNG